LPLQLFKLCFTWFSQPCFTVAALNRASKANERQSGREREIPRGFVRKSPSR